MSDSDLDTDDLREHAEAIRDHEMVSTDVRKLAEGAIAAADRLETLRDETEMYRDDFKSIFDLIDNYDSIDGAHHKQWVIDQIMRTLLDEGLYEEWREDLREQGYEWSEGVAP